MYRYKIQRAEMDEQAQNVTPQGCQSQEIRTLLGTVSPDRIHFPVSVPSLSQAKLIQYVEET